MKVSELKAYAQAQVPYTQYVINMFHSETSNDCIAVILGSSGRSGKNLENLQFQFLVRSTDPELAEAKAINLLTHFNNKSRYVIGTTTILLSRGQQSVPIYTGVDSSDRHIYSVNIDVIVDK